MKVKIITASAGSGKTYRLSQLLDEALRDGSAKPEGILATTFTKEAAAELVERARGRLLATGNHLGAQQLLAARIGTVNAVCGSLVKDFAFELGLSPATGVLEEEGAKVELHRALASVVSEERSTKIHRLKSRFASDLDWQFEVSQIIDAARANNLGVEDLPSCAEASIQELDACMGPVVDGDEIDRGLESAIASALDAIDLDYDTTKGTSEYVKELQACSRALAKKRLSWGKWAWLAKNAPRKKSEDLAVPVQEAAERHLEHARLRSEMHEFVRLLFAVAADGLVAYQERKRRLGVMDFGDQEAFALKLLQLPEVREELAENLDLVLVDEFQDTSPLQLAIFLELAALAKQSVWVGDPKQAIYAFRGTDPKLMDAAIEALSSVTHDPDLAERAASAIASSKVETLSTSYRSRPELVHSTSEIFAQAFASHGMPEERTRLTPQLQADPEEMEPVYETWMLEGRNQGVRGMALAAGVFDLLASERRVRIKGTSDMRKVAPKDVAILCRTNAQCQEIAGCLVEMGLSPVLSTMQLFDTQEGMLALAGLKLWSDARDSVAASVIARLCHFPEDLGAFVERAIALKGADAFAELPEVAAVVARSAEASDLGLLDILDAVCSALSIRRWCAAWGSTEQRLANLDAIRSHVVGYQSSASGQGGVPSLAGFLSFVDGLCDDFGWQNTRQDKQATVAGDDGIVVSTWHRAKGLEWPVTILYGLESLREPSAHGVKVMSRAQGFDLKAPLRGRWVRYWPSVYTNGKTKGAVRDAMESAESFSELAERSRKEALRVLYVGWTRARDQLILAGQEKNFTSGILGVLEEIDESLIDCPAVGATEVDWGGRTVALRSVSLDSRDGIPRATKPGMVSEGRVATAPIAARFSPSTANPLPASIVETAVIGEHLATKGCAEMAIVGDAVHAFLAADRRGDPYDARLALAVGVLERFAVSGFVEATSLLDASDRLWTWLDERYPDATVLREWPLAHKSAEGTLVSGSADLLVSTSKGFVVIDHKSFPGDADAAMHRALRYSGQLDAYATALQATTGRGASELWIHFPLVGALARVEVER